MIDLIDLAYWLFHLPIAIIIVGLLKDYVKDGSSE